MLESSNSPSPVYNPTTAKDLKRTAARVSLYDLLLLHEHFHPKKLRALCGSKSIYAISGMIQR
jgi:hypothetical protein